MRESGCVAADDDEAAPSLSSAREAAAEASAAREDPAGGRGGDAARGEPGELHGDPTEWQCSWWLWWGGEGDAVWSAAGEEAGVAAAAAVAASRGGVRGSPLRAADRKVANEDEKSDESIAAACGVQWSVCAGVRA